MVLLPTGGGKSLCYQLPALLKQELVIVISPLIALMDDQVQSAQQAGIQAEALHSQLKDQHRKRVYAKLKNNELNLLYLSPERLSIGDIITPDLKIQLIAIDEAHCISQWGHDFRPEYRQLGEIVSSFPNIPRMALTATATPQVQSDILAQLNLREPKVFTGYIDRPNLTYRSLPRDKLQQQLFSLVSKHPNEGGIIYAQTRKNVENIAKKLKEQGVKCGAYHAGLPASTRVQVQADFINENLDVVVATLAFGMGIDRSNVRYVIHANLPKSIEHYQQEAGRAGRDGLPASCYLLHHYSDIVTHRHLAQSSYPLGPQRKRQLEQQLKSISRYAWAPICRHEILVTHFGQDWPPEKYNSQNQSCEACDVCLGETKELPQEEALLIAQKIISAVFRSGSQFGAGHVIDILKGKTSPKVKQYGHQQLSVFSLMKDTPETALRTWIDQLILQKFLEMDESSGYPILKTTEKGIELCKQGGHLRLSEMDMTQVKSSSSRKSSKADIDWEGVDQDLFQKLRDLRKQLAEESGQPPYIIFSDESLRAMARSKPQNRTAFLRVKGVGEKKMALYGMTFMDCIKTHITQQ
jgi:ATP-dependent DNA helicase RecQ